MKEEDKELLLQDLCARLPYGIIGLYSWKNREPYNRELTGNLYDELKSSWNSTEDSKFLPYLRPMSSMTEEEILELYKIAYDTWYSDSLYYKNEEWINFRDSIKNNDLCFINCIWLSDINKVTDWLNKKMFDFRGLIPKGLAIKVTEENNPYESTSETY